MKKNNSTTALVPRFGDTGANDDHRVFAEYERTCRCENVLHVIIIRCEVHFVCKIFGV